MSSCTEGISLDVSSLFHYIFTERIIEGNDGHCWRCKKLGWLVYVHFNKILYEGKRLDMGLDSTYMGIKVNEEWTLCKSHAELYTRDVMECCKNCSIYIKSVAKYPHLMFRQDKHFNDICECDQIKNSMICNKCKLEAYRSGYECAVCESFGSYIKAAR